MEDKIDRAGGACSSVDNIMMWMSEARYRAGGACSSVDNIMMWMSEARYAFTGFYFTRGPKTLQKVPPKKTSLQKVPKNNGAFFRGEKKSNMCRRRRVFPLRRTKERSGREKRFAFS
jgi:hypothetical protein